MLVAGASVVSGRASQGEANAVEALPMPERYVREMLADWLGATRAYQGAYPQSLEAWAWWQQNRDRLVLHAESRASLDAALAAWFGGG